MIRSNTKAEVQDAVEDLMDKTKTGVPLGYTPLKGNRGLPRPDPHLTGERQAAVNRQNDPPA